MNSEAFEIQQKSRNENINQQSLCREERYTKPYNSNNASHGNAILQEDTRAVPSGDEIIYSMTKEQIEERLSELFANINEKRSHDLKLLTQMKEAIMAQAEKSCERLEKQMCYMHEAKGKELDDAVNKLLRVLDGIRALETELDCSKSSLNILCQDIQIPK